MSEISFTHFDGDSLDKAFDFINEQSLLELSMQIVAEAKGYASGFKGHINIFTHQFEAPTGRLRNSLCYKVGEENGGMNDQAGAQNDKYLEMSLNNNEACVGCNLGYAVYVEFGTRKMSPQPFLRPAIAIKCTDQSVGEIVKKRNEEYLMGKLEEGQQRTDFFK
jgi:HK97 gp10 family phage protein